MDKTALAIFAYNRSNHLNETLNAIFSSKEIPNNIYVFIDGPKNNDVDIKKVEEVTTTIDNFSENIGIKFNILKNHKNQGLANSIINGINHIFSNSDCEKIIVLEDDCKPSEDFFEYMHNSFNFYDKMNKKSKNKVMHISGFGLPLNYNVKNNSDTINYINYYPCSWGWGTWKKYWEKCDFEDNNYYNQILEDEELTRKFNSNGSIFSDFLKMQLDGRVNSWLIRWYAHLFKSQGLSTWKVVSSIDNSGFDGSGNHKVKFDRFNQTIKYKNELKNLNKPNNNDVKYSEEYFDMKIEKEFNRYFINKKDKKKISNILYFSKRKLRGV